MVDLSKLDKHGVAKLMDFSVLPKNSTEKDIRQGCALARQYGFAAFCFSSSFWTPVVVEELKGTDILVGAAVGFPFGAQSPKVKACETQEAVEMGATTLDMVMNIGALLSGDLATVRQELRDFVAAAGGHETKVILETCFLKDADIALACNLLAEAGVNFAKTSSGQFEGPSLEHVLVMRDTLKDTNVKIKVAGVKFPRPQNAYVFIMAGAERIGTRAAPEIVDALDQLRDLGLVPKYRP